MLLKNLISCLKKKKRQKITKKNRLSSMLSLRKTLKALK